MSLSIRLYQLIFSSIFIFHLANASQTSIQLADHYGAQILSLTDAAQFIEFLMNDFKIENQWNVQMLERKIFWQCSNGKKVELDEKKKNQHPEEKQMEWPHFSRKLCKNIYLLLSIVDVELIMFGSELDQAVKNKYIFDLFHFAEKKVTDVITLNFKLSRLFGLGRILVAHFLKLTSKNEEGEGGFELDGRVIDQSAYLDRLQYFTRQTEALLAWMKTNEKFKLSEKHGFWWWLKNSQKHVLDEFEKIIREKEGGFLFHWMHDQSERMDFQNVYEKMQQDQQDEAIVQQKKEEDDKRPFFMKLLHLGGENAAPGENNLFNQPPWCLFRVHRKAAIFGQIEKRKMPEAAAQNEKGEKEGIIRQKRATGPGHATGYAIGGLSGNGGSGGHNAGGVQSRVGQHHEKNEYIEKPKEHWILIEKKLADEKLKYPKIKIKNEEIMQMLKLMDTEDFEKIKENTGKNAIKHFIEKSYKNLINLKINKNALEAAGILLKKIKMVMEEMSMFLIENTGVECPVQFYDESFSIEEENLFGLAVFYKFAIYLANSMQEKEVNVAINGQQRTQKRRKRGIPLVGKGIELIKNIFHRNGGKEEQKVDWNDPASVQGTFKNKFGELMKRIGENEKLKIFIIDQQNEGEEGSQIERKKTMQGNAEFKDHLEALFRFEEHFEVENGNNGSGEGSSSSNSENHSHSLKKNNSTGFKYTQPADLD